MNYTTEQEEFWAGEFGEKYINRNSNAEMVISNIALFTKILKSTTQVSSVLEFGANIGLNLIALKKLLPELDISAVEINESAVQELKKIEDLKISHSSILDFEPVKQKELVLIKGVLIHINPDYLEKVYQLLYDSSCKYICIAEYYNPTPVEVLYHGKKKKLFKRDFAGEVLDMFSDIKLVDYGFVYHRDNYFPQDDITWFLLEKE